MVKHLGSILFLASFFGVPSAYPEYGRFGPDDRVLATIGAGVMVGPTLALFTPQVEWASGENIRTGPLLQAGLGDSTLITASWSGRFIPSGLQPLKPFLEGALGVAGGGGDFGSGVGFHLMLGFGFDYRIDKNVTVAGSLRANLCPPIKTAVLTIPLLMGRFAL